MTSTRRFARPTRIAAAAGATATAVLATALPASAHPSFASSPTVNFLPNALGGTGVSGTAPPYRAGSSPTVVLRLPDEDTATFNGKDNNTVQATVTIPSGWTNPACGDVRNQVNNAFTFNTNQPGDLVAGWTCAVETRTDGHKVLHWTGPQAATSAESAQFFAFTVTTPSPSIVTRYGSLSGSGFETGEGFYSDQIYASGAGGDEAGIRHWIPPNAPNATIPNPAHTGAPGDTTPATIANPRVASGLLRTVAPSGAFGSGAGQTIQVTVPQTSPVGELTLSIPANGAIDLTTGTATAGYYPFSGALNTMTLSDTRAGGPGWSVSGVASAFSGLDADSARYLGWTPKVLSPGAGAVASPVVANALDTPAGPGLQTSKGLATGTSAAGTPNASLSADLNLKLPVATPPGTYSSTMTITAI